MFCSANGHGCASRKLASKKQNDDEGITLREYLRNAAILSTLAPIIKHFPRFGTVEYPVLVWETTERPLEEGYVAVL
jgi:hypothetical protein